MTSSSGAASAARTLSDPEAEAALLNQWRDGAQCSAAAYLRRFGLAPECDFTNDLAQEALLRLLIVCRRGQAPSDRYVRRVIANAVKRAGRQLLSAAGVEHGEDAIDDLPASDIRHQADVMVATAVQHWVRELPAALRHTYFNVYVRGETQRSTAVKMGVTQPRVAQLHAKLLEAGRDHLEWLAAR